MDYPDTVTEAMVALREEGYTVQFQLIDGALQCTEHGVGCSVSDAQVERLFRFEGDSDPGDEMVVFALLDPVTGTRGVLASAFGSSADPEIIDHLVGLSTRHRGP